MADSISQNAARYRELVANGRWAIQTVWRTSPYPAGGMLALLVLRSGVPAGLALVARGLVNAAVGAMQASARCTAFSRSPSPSRSSGGTAGALFASESSDLNLTMPCATEMSSGHASVHALTASRSGLSTLVNCSIRALHPVVTGCPPDGT